MPATVDAIKYFETVPLDSECLNMALQVLAKRLLEHRIANRGFTPKEIFTSCIAIGGVYTSFELAIAVLDEGGTTIGYALKLRDNPDEIGWKGQYQIVGATTTREGPGDAKRRLGKELSNNPTFVETLFERMQFVGVDFQDTPERSSRCFSLMHVLELSEKEFSFLKGTWKAFSVPKDDVLQDEMIVPEHRAALRWLCNRHRPRLVNLVENLDYPST